VGDLNHDIYTDLVAIRGDDKFVVYLYDPTAHKFVDIGQEYEANCIIDSINIATISKQGNGIFLKCSEGKGSSFVKAY
jgi:hypothetical protein